MQPGDELTDLTELVGPELATLVTADPSRSIPMDIANINQSDLFNCHNIDFDKFLGEFSQSGGEGGSSSSGGHTFRKVIIARKDKEKSGAVGGEGGSDCGGDNNNNNNNNSVTGRFVPVQSCEGGSKALLLQHREPRGEAGALVRGGGGEAVTLTVVRGDPGGPRGGQSPALALVLALASSRSSSC